MYQYIDPQLWNGAAMLVKAGDGFLVNLEITTGAESAPFYLHYYDAAATVDANSSNRFWVTPLPASYVSSVDFGAVQGFRNGLVLQITANSNGTGGAPVNTVLICGRYQ